MTISRPTTLLHISDIHFAKSTEQEFEIIWRAFKARVNRLKEENDGIDFVCLTGDLVKKADDSDVYYTLLEKYLMPLFDELGCYDRVMFCPGNHDASRSYVEESLDDHEALRDLLTSAAADVSEQQLLDLQDKKFQAFRDNFGVISSVSRVGANPLFPTYYDKTHNLAFVCLNSALLTVAGVKKISDERRLFIPTHVLEKSLEVLPSPAQWIFLMHHPIDWLGRPSAVELQRIINHHNGLLLHGHMHEGRPSNSEDIFGQCFSHQAGALHSSDPGRFNGFAILRLIPGHPHFEVNLQSFFPIRSAFDAAVEICPDGQFYSSKAAKEFWQNPPVPTNLAALRQWIETSLLSHLIHEFEDPMAERPLEEIFVEPPLTKVQPEHELTASLVEDETEVTLDKLLAGSENLLFVAGRESGRSSILKASAFHLLKKNSEKAGVFTVPIIVNFQVFSRNAALALRTIKRELPEGAPAGWSTVRLLEYGFVTLFVDDFSEYDMMAVKALSDFMKKYPKNRYILTSEKQVQAVISPTLQVELPVPVSIIEIGNLRPRHVRSLIAKWKKITPEDAEPLQKKIMEDTLAMNLPLTGNNIAILIQLDEVPEIIRPVNRAALVERFIELLLRKHSLTEILRAKYDFHNKTHFLAWVAAKMVFSDQYLVESAWLEKCTREYVEKYELDIPVNQWISQFLDARILKYENGSYSYKFRVFLEYFIAQAMNNDESLFSYVLDEKRYLAFGNEIDFYSGITRTDDELIESVASRFEKLHGELMKESTWTPDLARFNAMSEPRFSSKERPDSLFADVSRQLDLPPMTSDQRDQVWDLELPKNVGQDQQVKRPKTEDYLDARKIVGQYYGTLSLYSRLVRNTELIGGETKRRHLDVVLQGWAEF